MENLHSLWKDPDPMGVYMMDFYVTSVNISPKDRKDPWGLSAFTPEPALRSVGLTVADRWISAWRVAGSMRRRMGGQWLVTVAEGTAQEYAPNQKPPPKYKEHA